MSSDASRERRSVVVVRGGPLELPAGAGVCVVTLQRRPPSKSGTRRYLVRIGQENEALAVRSPACEPPAQVEELLWARRRVSASSPERLIERLAGLPQRDGRLVVGAGRAKDVRQWRHGRSLVVPDAPLLPVVGEVAVDARGIAVDRLRAMAVDARPHGLTTWLRVCGLGSWMPLDDPQLQRWISLGFDVTEFWLPEGLTRVQRWLLPTLPRPRDGWTADVITGHWTAPSERAVDGLARRLRRLPRLAVVDRMLVSRGHVTVDFEQGSIRFEGRGDHWVLGPKTRSRLHAALREHGLDLPPLPAA